MKKIIFVFSLMTATTLAVFGQDPLIYTDVVHVDNATKDELYNRAKLWFATAYNSSSDVLQIENKDAGQIVGKAIMKYSPTVFSGREQTEGNIKYTIKIYVKEGRYKYVFTDFIHDPYGNKYGKYSVGLVSTDNECPNPKPMAKGWSNKVWNDIKNQINNNITPLLSDLKSGMEKQSETELDDW